MDDRARKHPGTVFQSVIALFCWLIRRDMELFRADPVREERMFKDVINHVPGSRCPGGQKRAEEETYNE